MLQLSEISYFSRIKAEALTVTYRNNVINLQQPETENNKHLHVYKKAFLCSASQCPLLINHSKNCKITFEDQINKQIT